VKKIDKQLFLKPIRKHLFFGFDGTCSIDIITIVDDSLVKHVLNSIKNAILPEPWTFASIGQSDTYLMDTLLPWVLQLHVN
jgi:hypothetical protein